MKRYFSHCLIVLLLLGLLAPVAAAQSIEIRLSDGSRWRGQVSDQVQVTFAQRGTPMTVTGELIREGDLFIEVVGDRRWVIIKSDIRAMSTVKAEPTRTPRRGDSQPRQQQEGDAPPRVEGPGVFVLPLTGMVGPRIHHKLIEDMVAEADKHGPGQIIILEIRTGGGAVIEMEQIARVILDAKRRHRFVAWVHEAISAGCATAILCHEIYFTTMGRAGAMTAFDGSSGQSWQGDELQRWLHTAGQWMEAGGRDPRIARAMIHAPLTLSYDKDPETGRVSFHSNLNGQYILSRPGENLTFNSNNAVHSGFADGIADSTSELATLLDLPAWREISDYGRRLHADWNALMDRAEREIPRTVVRFNRGIAGDTQANLNYRIQRVREMIQWWERGEIGVRFIDGAGPSKEFWETLLRELMHQQRTMRSR